FIAGVISVAVLILFLNCPTAKTPRVVCLSAGAYIPTYPSVLQSFCPQEIKVRWLKNGQGVTEGVFYREELHNGDWMFQTQVLLEDTLQHSDVYACQEEHASLEMPISVRWDYGGVRSESQVGVKSAAALPA
uniref:Ig-like domain-containing protein n=1 Tax=Varanus komodoensis TaxID=61221 RepID=A0A8D2J0C0_VARKO